jgi:hypothetical protein
MQGHDRFGQKAGAGRGLDLPLFDVRRPGSGTAWDGAFQRYGTKLSTMLEVSREGRDPFSTHRIAAAEWRIVSP